jgi:hypothetical protein
MPELRAPENSRTGMEIKPKVRYPDQTEAAMVHLAAALESCAWTVSLNYNQGSMPKGVGGNPE